MGAIYCCWLSAVIDYLASEFIDSVSGFRFQVSGRPKIELTPHMKLHFFRQDNRINRIYFYLVGHYPVDPVNPVRKLNGQNTLFGVRCWTFDVRRSLVFLSIRLAALRRRVNFSGQRQRSYETTFF
jgi:hypothetical protein